MRTNPANRQKKGEDSLPAQKSSKHDDCRSSQETEDFQKAEGSESSALARAYRLLGSALEKQDELNADVEFTETLAAWRASSLSIGKSRFYAPGREPWRR